MRRPVRADDLGAGPPPPPGGSAAHAVNWAQLYAECRAPMIEAAARRIRARHAAELEAADVVNEIFVTVISDPPRTVPDWRTFLVDITVQRVELSAEGTERWRCGVTIDDLATGEPLAEDAAMTAIRRVNAGEVRKRILRVMDYMTDRQRQITRLRLFEGLSVGEIAAVMNTSSSNVSQIVIRCLAKLQPVLTQFDTLDDADLERVRPPRRVR